MNMSSVFIRRPIATSLLWVAVTLAGVVAYQFLTVSSLPKIDFPAISVTASLPGASAETMAGSVATPLIQELEAIPAVEEVRATNIEGSTSIEVAFSLGRDIDRAAADVQAAIVRAQGRLPASMPSVPSYRKVDPTDTPVLLIALTSASRSLVELHSFARRALVPALKEIEGVGEVSLSDSQKHAVRINIDPFALAARNLAVGEVERAIREASDNTPLGAAGGKEQRILLKARTQLDDAAAFRNLIVTSPSGNPLRLGDVADVKDSVTDDSRASRYDGRDAIILSIRRQSDADMLSVAQGIRSALPRLQERLGPGASIDIVRDRSYSVIEAVDDVQATLAMTAILMFAALYCLTGRFSATLIPTIVVPVCIALTFGAFYALGYSLNNITLLALTLSIGLMVDDAIVVHENIVRRVEHGDAPMEAARQGAGEVGFTVVSMTISLLAVFIPVLLMSGVVGRILNSFAVTVIVALLASALVSITLTPMIAAHWLKPANTFPVRRNGFERGFDRLAGAYESALDFCLRFRAAVLLLFLVSVAATFWMLQIIPKGFLPQEDIGQIAVSVRARPDISFSAMADLQGRAEDILRQSPHVKHVLSEIGGQESAPLNESTFYVELKGKSERPPIDRVIAELRRGLAAIPGMDAFVSTTQDARMGGGKNRGKYQFIVQSHSLDEIAHWTGRIVAAMERHPAFSAVTSDVQNMAVQASLEVDGDKANLLGISSEQVRTTLYSAFGGGQVATIHQTTDSYKVLMQIDPAIATMAESLEVMHVRSDAGALVPLSAIASFNREAGMREVNQVGPVPAVTVYFDLAPGTALGDAVTGIEEIAKEVRVPASVTIAFGGATRIFQEALANQGLLLAAAVFAVYLVLAILYESLIHPLTILTGLPAAAAGALGALMLFDLDLSLMALIGILILVGLVKKNAIMMIDVALVLQRQGASGHDAIKTACLQRFRPIMMTTLAAIAGALPIAVGHGASSELRQPLGVAVAGGLAVSQLLTLFITPVIFLYMDGMATKARALLAYVAVARIGDEAQAGVAALECAPEGGRRSA